MKKVVSLIAIACAAAFSSNAMAQNSPSPLAVKPFIGAGLTIGGDKLATAVYTNGDEADVRAGGFVQLYGGLEFAVGTDWAMSASVGYHIDDATAQNGSLKFKRVPFEVMAHYKLNNQWRVGAGARFVSGATFGGSGVLSTPDVEFDSTTGAVLQAEYFFNPKTSLIVRGVSEKYKFRGTSIDGSHLGLMFNYYFN